MSHAGETWPELPAVAQPATRPRGWARLVVCVIVMAWLVANAAFLTWCRSRSFTLGYATAEAGTEQQRLLDEQHSLELELTSLRSPDRVGEVAAGRMGLRPPRASEVVHLTAPDGPTSGRLDGSGP